MMLASFPSRGGRKLTAIPVVAVGLILLYMFIATDDLYTRTVFTFEVSREVTHHSSASYTAKNSQGQAVIDDELETATYSGGKKSKAQVVFGDAARSSSTLKKPESQGPGKKWDYEVEKADALARGYKPWDGSKDSPKFPIQVAVEDEEPLEPAEEDEDEELFESDNPEYVALCLYIKNQPFDLVEWLVHHYQHVGISHFYVMDDGSNPPLSQMKLPDSVPQSAVTFHDFDNPVDRVEHMQLHVYDECIKLHGNKHEWMGFIDVDEFIQIKGGDTLKSLLYQLDKNETVGALAMNWEIHTSNGLKERPYSARKSFTTCIEDPESNQHISTGTDNEHIKSLVKTEFYESADNPHKMTLKEGAVTVGELGDIVEGETWRFPVTRETISLHHYSVKSRKEFQEKMHRTSDANYAKEWEHWDRIHTLKTRTCNDMMFYEP